MTTERAAIAAAIASFPKTFGLRAFPGEAFRFCEWSSYTSEGRPMLYIEKKVRHPFTGWVEWHEFAKGAEVEMKAQIVTIYEGDEGEFPDVP